MPDSTELLVTDVGPTERITATAPRSAAFSTAEGRIAVDVSSVTGPLSVTVPVGADAEVSVNGLIVLARVGGADSFPGPEPTRTPGGLSFTVVAP